MVFCSVSFYRDSEIAGFFLAFSFVTQTHNKTKASSEQMVAPTEALRSLEPHFAVDVYEKFEMRCPAVNHSEMPKLSIEGIATGWLNLFNIPVHC